MQKWQTFVTQEKCLKNRQKGRAEPGGSGAGCGIMAVALEAFCLMMFRWFVALL